MARIKKKARWEYQYHHKPDIVVIRGLKEWVRRNRRWPRPSGGGLESYFYNWLRRATRGKSRELLDRELVEEYPEWRKQVFTRDVAGVQQAISTLQSLAAQAPPVGTADLERSETYACQKVRIWPPPPPARPPTLTLPLSHSPTLPQGNQIKELVTDTVVGMVTLYNGNYRPVILWHDTPFPGLVTREFPRVIRYGCRRFSMSDRSLTLTRPSFVPQARHDEALRR